MDYISIKEASLRIGCDHHFVRALVKRGRLVVDHTEPINAGVNKVYLTKESVKAYMESRRVRRTVKLRLTAEEEDAVRVLLKEMRYQDVPDW